MTESEKTQIVMKTIKVELGYTHDMLVNALINLKNLEQRGLNAFAATSNEVKQDPKEHNYDATSAYAPNSADKAYMRKGDLTYKTIKF